VSGQGQVWTTLAFDWPLPVPQLTALPLPPQDGNWPRCALPVPPLEVGGVVVVVVVVTGGAVVVVVAAGGTVVGVVGALGDCTFRATDAGAVPLPLLLGVKSATVAFALPCVVDTGTPPGDEVV
jgi:hypothetical protein